MAGSSIREQVLLYVIAQLSAITGIAKVFRDRVAPVGINEGAVAIVHFADDQVAHPGGNTTFRRLTFCVVYIVRGDPPDPVADPVMVAGHAAIMADPTFGALVGRCLERETTWDYEYADSTALMAETRYTVEYHTTATDISAQ